MKLKVKSLNRVLALTIAFVMIMTGIGISEWGGVNLEEAWADEIQSMTDEQALEVIYDEFYNGGYNLLSTTPLEFPQEYEGQTYTNIYSYIKAWALKNTGKEIEVSGEIVNATVNYTNNWISGQQDNFQYTLLDEDGTVYGNSYYLQNNSSAGCAIKNPTFTIGDQSVSLGTYRYIRFKVKSLQRTPQEIVKFISQNLPFERIKGKNTSADNVTQPVGAFSATKYILPNADTLYNTTSATIEWSSSDDALKISSSDRSTTILRPNVGEEDAKVDLTATITSKTDSSAVETKVYNLTIPAFEAIVIPVQITEGATLKLTDGYYSNKAVEDKYIAKQDSVSEGYDLYNCTLHANATGGSQSFGYTVEKDGYITKTGTINVEDKAYTDPITIDLSASSEEDNKLKRFEVLTEGIETFTFDPDITDYYVTVKGNQYIALSGAAAVEGASVKIAYYSNLANANNNKTATANLSSTTTGTKCYLPDAIGNTDIVITVTAPASSTLTEKERIYTLHVDKVAASGPLTALKLTASSSEAGKVNNISNDIIVDEETLSPAFIAGNVGTTYYYTTNYYRDKVSVTPTGANSTITVNGKSVTSGKASETIDLEVGDNTISITAEKNGEKTDYTVIVHRKEELRLTDIDVEGGGLSSTLAADGSAWTSTTNFRYDADSVTVSLSTNIVDGVTIDVTATGFEARNLKPNEKFEVPVKGSDKIILYIWLYRDVNGIKEGQKYVVSLNRQAADSPTAVASYLPAPGQFVNLDIYQNPEKTLTGLKGTSLITLGAFGGNVVYQFDEPITNDPNNPYGIDFIIAGNCFTNTDGTTSSGAAEPAAVMVSEDGVNWYELAGSEYYEAGTKHDITVTYKNGDTSYSEAADTEWTDSKGKSGILPKNQYHNQPYYPNPTFYSKYQTSVGSNDSYTTDTVSFTGTMIEANSFPAFGYGDTHSVNTALGNQATNPYRKDHSIDYNGDGFDLAWAVDSDGNPVELTSVKYVKVYNATLSYGTATGEKSPEIGAVVKALPAGSEQGVSDRLTALKVNGKDVSLTDGVYSYTIDGDGAETLVITPTTDSPDANIYVSNQYVVSGESSKSITAVEKTRIIVQEGTKEPVIYILNFNNVTTVADNAKLLSLSVVPGNGIEYNPNDSNQIIIDVAENVSAVRLTGITASDEAVMTLSGGQLTQSETLSYDSPSVPLKLSSGRNEFTLTVKSASGNNTETYLIIINQKTTATQEGIQVTFSLLGDKIHYDKSSGEYTGTHSAQTWISAIKVNMPDGSTVKDLTEMMLMNYNLSYVTDGTYISEINGLAHFDNGPNSGWMYRQNGLIADEGYATRKLQNGDIIKWFYTDDYTKETGYEGNWDSVNQSAAQAPTITLTDETGTVITDGGSAVYDPATGILTITPAQGYEIKDVKVNGVSKGAVTSIKGLTKDDKVTVIFAKTEDNDEDAAKWEKIKAGVEATTIKLRTIGVGKGYIKVKWTKSKGYKVDGYQIFRSLKRYSGFGKKPFFTKPSSKLSDTYKNTKALKSGTRYYYKVRGYRIIEGKTYYTKWSNKAWWIAK